MSKLPLPDGAVDVVLSNCVINLSADKDRVLRGAFRRWSGRIAVSDIVVAGVPVAVRENIHMTRSTVPDPQKSLEHFRQAAALQPDYADAGQTRFRSSTNSRRPEGALRGPIVCRCG